MTVTTETCRQEQISLFPTAIMRFAGMDVWGGEDRQLDLEGLA